VLSQNLGGGMIIRRKRTAEPQRLEAVVTSDDVSTQKPKGDAKGYPHWARPIAFNAFSHVAPFSVIASGSAVHVKRLGLSLVSARYRLIAASETETAKLPHKGRFRWFQRLFHFWFDMASPRFQSGWIMISSSFAGLRRVVS